MYCAICLYTFTGTLGEDQEAVTVMGGTAVCQEHLGHVRDAQVNNAVSYFKELNREQRGN